MTSQQLPRLHGIVAAVDGSPPSETALAWAARDASLRDVPLTVVHVQPSDEVGPWLDLPISEEYLEARDRQSTGIVDRAVELAGTAMEGRRRVPVEKLVLRGPVMPALLDVSKDSDMMVVGCRGLGALAGLLLGSTSSALVHHAHCPVAVVHEHSGSGIAVTAPVVVGVDASPASELAIAIAYDEASRRGVELVEEPHALLGVGQPITLGRSHAGRNREQREIEEGPEPADEEHHFRSYEQDHAVALV